MLFIHPETKDEWALARTEESTGDSYKDFNVTADETVSLEEDLHRRDLTINAMAKDMDTGELIDPHGGLEDIEQEYLRHVSPAFAEDPLRVIRVATFSARYPEFTVHPETRELCKELVPQLETIAPQRMREEVSKMFRKAEDPRKFFDTLREFDALETVFPIIHDMTDISAGPDEYHKEGSAYEHTMHVLTEAHSINSDNERILWAALGHDMGKVATDDESQSYPLHEKNGPDVVEEFAESIKLDNTTHRVMTDAARYHMRFHQLEELREATLIRMVDRFGEPNLTIDEFMSLGLADSRGREPSRVEISLDTAEHILQSTNTAIEEFGGGEAFEKFDVSKEDGKKVGNLILQERINILKEKL